MQESTPSSGASQGDGGDPFRVMVVDDSAVIRGLITRALEADHSIKVVASVGNGDIAIKSLDRYDVEVVILDIEMQGMMNHGMMMPKGMTGPELAHKATRINKNLKVLLTSGYPDSELEKSGVGVATFEFLRKPYSNEQLIEALNSVMAK